MLRSSVPCISFKFFLLAACILPLGLSSGCAPHSLGEVLGTDATRIRSAEHRMLLADEKAAARRFVDFGAMAELVYEDADGEVQEGDRCMKPLNLCKSKEKKRAEVRENLHRHLRKAKWERELLVSKLEGRPALKRCEDDYGLFYGVWTRKLENQPKEVVFAFRGTQFLTCPDWRYGNLHHLWGEEDNQYHRAWQEVQVWINFYEKGGEDVIFYTAGHSLGAGVAQHILYRMPHKIRQVYAFNPSWVTGYTYLGRDRLKGCECPDGKGSAEARIYRIYESDEILAGPRFIIKSFFLPNNRHIQEVRFGGTKGDAITEHNMGHLANLLLERSEFTPKERHDISHVALDDSWIQGQKAPEHTEIFKKAQKKACLDPQSKHACRIPKKWQ